MYIELTKRTLSKIFQYDTLQRLDLSQNSLAEVKDLLQVLCIMLFKWRIYYSFNLVLVFIKSEESCFGFYCSAAINWQATTSWRTLSEENKLMALPEIICFCKKLWLLNLEGNRFVRLPGAILKLQNLEDLWKFNNPLKTTLSSAATSVGDEHSNHVGLLPRKSTTTTTSTADSAPTVHNPQLLQTLCCKVLAQHSVPYWNAPYLPPLTCRALDLIHTEYVKIAIQNKLAYKKLRIIDHSRDHRKLYRDKL